MTIQTKKKKRLKEQSAPDHMHISAATTALSFLDQ